MIGHEIITASAGSGKTWSLVVRYLRLLALGAEPGSIIALTFSRKAAGEFFTAILHRLAEAALTDEAAARLAEDVQIPGTGRAEFVRLLAVLVREMPRLTLGTMDSFFVRIARSFPLELGLGGDFAILDDHHSGIEQARVLQRVFAPGEMKEEGRREFLTAFQQATWGKDEARLKRLLTEFLDQWMSYYFEAPQEPVWGNPDAIWPGGRPQPAEEQTREQLLTAARKVTQSAPELNDKQREVLESIFVALDTHTPGTPLAHSMLGRLLEALPALEAGTATVMLARKDVEMHGPLTAALHHLLARLVADTLTVCLHQTRGIFGILALYDRHYNDMVRRQGRLTFQDVQLILSGGLVGASRENIDYRLDARYAHWLLDEFQDTSRVQWRVLHNLCDEAIQDHEGTRSFFAVGDEKQSIFTWRGADPALFGEIQKFYGPAIKVRPLARSQRSGPAIISQVNRLCGAKEKLAQLDGLAGAVQRWNWQEHVSAHPERTGCAVVIEVPGSDDVVDPVWAACADLLKEIHPLRRGLTCAVLCHRNSQAAEIADALRLRTGMEVVCESDVRIATDNPAASALLALFKAAAHPADEFSWQHLLMSPLGEVIAARWPDAGSGSAHARQQARRAPFTAEMLAQITAEGFAITLRTWCDRLRHHLPALDSFSRGRLEELCRTAQEFDDTGSRDADEFTAFAEAARIRESACTTAIQVMTLHKSKGLTFDIVILPDLHDKSMFMHRQRTGIARNDDREISWITQLPNKDIAAADPVIAAAMNEAVAAQWRERLAQLYVAVTRARRANYLLLPPPPKSSDSVTLHKLVRHMITGDDKPATIHIGPLSADLLDVEGDLGWFHAVPLIAKASAPATDLFTLTTAPPAKKPATSTPVRAIPSAARYSARREGRRFGTLVHSLLSRVEWSGPGALDALEQFFRRTLPRPDESETAALQSVRRCLTDPAIAAALAASSPDAVLWRERPFEAVIAGQLVSGVFDRVTLTAGRVHLLEYKTDALRDDQTSLTAAIARHSRQTQLYRAALQQLTGLPPASITASFLFTSLPLLVAAPD